MAGSLSPHPTRHSARSIRSARSSLLRSDLKRHTYTGKRTIQRSMISSPQGEVKHTGHVGLDGAYFGDISFLDPAGCVSNLLFRTRIRNIIIFRSFVTFVLIRDHYFYTTLCVFYEESMSISICV